MARFHWYLDPLSRRQPKEVVKVGPPLTKLPYSAHVYFVCANISRGTKVEKMLTLAPERYTAEFCMVAKVILWCI